MRKRSEQNATTPTRTALFPLLHWTLGTMGERSAINFLIYQHIVLFFNLIQSVNRGVIWEKLQKKIYI